jgi:hypothetical protein
LLARGSLPVLLAVACVPRPRDPARAAAPVCAPPAALPPADRVRIDGWFGPRLNDSLVIVVDGRERWRGLYRLCSEAPALSARVAWMPATADSVRSVQVVHGAAARQTYGIGGTRPSALLIETLRGPAGLVPAPPAP